MRRVKEMKVPTRMKKERWMDRSGARFRCRVSMPID